MSVSQTYRPVIPPTEAELAAMRVAAERNRIVESVLPEMVAHLRGQAGQLARAGTLGETEHRHLEQRLDGVGDLASARSIAVLLATTSLGSDPAPAAMPLGPTPGALAVTRTTTLPIQVLPGHLVPGGPTPAQRVSLPELVADHLQLSIELRSVRATAESLGVTVTLGEVDAHLVAAGTTLSGGHAGTAPARLAIARRVLDAAAAVVDDALVAAEAQADRAATVATVLGEIGFTLAAVERLPDGTVAITADGPGGRTAEVRLTDAAPDVECDVTFRDTRDAVAPDHPDADAVCTNAAEDALGFHRRLGRAPGFRPGPVVARSRPTRGAGDAPPAPASATKRTRRQTPTTPHARRTR